MVVYIKGVREEELGIDILKRHYMLVFNSQIIFY